MEHLFDETHSIGIDLDDDVPPNHMDCAPARTLSGTLSRSIDDLIPTWDWGLREPGSLFDRLPRRERAYCIG